ncbi:MAG TPA: hypothetical protein VMI09_02030 [Candidatus Binataceae bacterium]|nr:hypothetical protein [Candidatus Binataceae bacterium]
MIVAVSRFKTGAAEAAEIEERFRARPRLVDLHEGFLGLESCARSDAIRLSCG